MTRFTLVALATGAAAALFATSASADTWSGVYDATIVSTYADGHVVRVYVDPDHTYRIVPTSGETIRGTWSDNAYQSCFVIISPAAYAGGAPSCYPLRDYKVGDAFDGVDAAGASFHGVITAGR